MKGMQSEDWVKNERDFNAVTLIEDSEAFVF